VNGSLQTTPARTRVSSPLGGVHGRAEREQVPLRDAAYLIAVEPVAHACREREWV
jgi:hypothetical protein